MCPRLRCFYSYSTYVQEKSGDERSDAGSQQAEEDYDVDEEYDNDYAENYFDNGEVDENDDLGGVGGDEGGGGMDPLLTLLPSLIVYRLQDTTTTERPHNVIRSLQQPSTIQVRITRHPAIDTHCVGNAKQGRFANVWCLGCCAHNFPGRP